jgi:signal transduction histidine kinase
VTVGAGGTGNELLEALAAGANDFVRKPVSPVELSARLAGLARMAELHASLRAAESQLRIEAEFRERFMGMLAHDLRQPLQTISMACALRSNSDPAGKADPVIGRALRAADRMKRMIADLLDFTRSRPESGMPVQRRSTDLEEVARAIIEEMRAAHPERQFDLRVSGVCRGHWDPDRLAQLLTNLIGNAIEHGNPSCTVDVRLASQGDQVILQVENEGPDIAPEAMPTLFQPFRSGRPGQRSTGGGVGLGLHIVQRIVAAHGGTTSVTSQDSRTQFVVRLPVDEPPRSGFTR